MTVKKQPYGINNIVSWGATVVIVGLMFKILHLPGATWFIAGGLSAEAILFFLLGFQREPVEIDWRRAYPELDEDFDGDLPKATKKVTATPGFGNTAALDKMLEDAKVGPELINSLANGLRTFGDKVNSISRVTDAGDATIAFTNKVKQATASYDQLGAAFEKASVGMAEMAGSSTNSKAYADQVARMTHNVTQLNSVYELELKDSSNHLKSMNQFYTNLSATMQNFNDSLNDSKQFKDEIGRLAKNLSSLNAVYGNMLSAMNQPRVNQ